MTDRELLELAAKAAGIERCANALGMYFLEEEDRYWNPLTDDGDALRLAVKLGFVVNCWIAANETYAGQDDGDGVNEAHNNDPYAATRIAIVRAAAEIGKRMK